MLQLVEIFLNVLAPVFIILGLAYAITKPLGLNSQTLSRIAYYVLTPAFVFALLSSARIDVALALRMIGFITAVYVGSTLIAFLFARLLKRSREMTSAWMMIASFGNVGNFGLPIAQFAEGNQALLPATVYFLANLVFAFVVCVTLANVRRDNLGQSVLRVLKTPGLIAVLPALLVNSLALPVPTVFSRVADLLASALVPAMLLALGVQFANVGLPRVTPDMVIGAGIRLISGPALAFALAGAFGLSGVERNVGILQASMPTAVLVSIIALESKLLPEYVTATVLFSNLASILTLPMVLAFLA
ncbi:MAG: AEC family transporter [Thermoflexales bacterium]|nr:AEC family transporter [Thermoflexales bacterium]